MILDLLRLYLKRLVDLRGQLLHLRQALVHLGLLFYVVPFLLGLFACLLLGLVHVDPVGLLEEALGLVRVFHELALELGSILAGLLYQSAANLFGEISPEVLDDQLILAVGEASRTVLPILVPRIFPIILPSLLLLICQLRFFQSRLMLTLLFLLLLQVYAIEHA